MDIAQDTGNRSSKGDCQALRLQEYTPRRSVTGSQE